MVLDQLNQIGLAGCQALDKCLQLRAIQHGQARFERWTLPETIWAEWNSVGATETDWRGLARGIFRLTHNLK